MTQQKRTRHQRRNSAHGYDTAAPQPDGRKRRYADDDSEFALDDGTPITTFTGDPAAVIPKEARLVVVGKRYFKLAPHQRVIESHYLGRFGKGREGDYGFKILRDPVTGWPVVREHGDLKPGEISLVLE